MLWDDTKCLLAVARTGQMKAAAAQLSMDQATLGRRIAALEASLGTKLVHRQSRGTVLTDEGRALLPRIEEIETAFREIETRITGADRSVSGSVRLGVPDGFGVGYLASRIPRILETHPDLRIELVPVSRSFSLSEREADIAILVGRPEKGRLIARKLADYSIGVYGAKSYLEKFPAIRTASDLDDHRLVGYVESLVESPALNYASTVFGKRRPDLEIASGIGQVEAVASGAGIGVLHDFLASGRPELQRILPAINIKRAYWIAWHESLANLARIRATVDFIAGAVHADRNLFTMPETRGS